MADALPNTSASVLPPPVVAAEQRAREFLAQGKWRKARDEIKPLVKTDRARYLPLLIEANVGLAREMVAKGQVTEARQVLAYLATIAPAEQLRTVELEIAGHSGDRSDFLGKFAAALSVPQASLPEAERVRLADQVVLAFEPLRGENPDSARLAAELRAIHEALQAASGQQWERVPEILRPIPHRSVFSHWAVFVKGLMAFHTGDAERAARWFGSLPPGSVPAKASQAYLLLANRIELPQGNQPLAEAVVEGVCHLTGQTGVSRLLLRAERLWNEGKHTESYRVFRDSVAQFPTDGPDLLGALSEFFFQAPHAMSEEERDSYLGFFDGLLYRSTVKNSVEKMRALRLFVLADGEATETWALRADWEEFLRLHQQLYQPNPRLASIAYGWLGEQLAKAAAPALFGFGQREPVLRDAAGARECLRKAIDLDPANLAAHLQLSRVYGALNQRSERNRLLDEMTERFPEEKAVLLEAARGCVERKAYIKGLNLLERARHLDRLDSQIPDMIVTVRRQLARQYYEQRRADKGRQALEPTQEFLIDNPDNFQRSRWTMLLRRGLLEQLYGDAAQGEALLAQARAASPFAAAFLFFAHLTHRIYSRRRHNESPFLDALRAEFKQDPSAARAVLLLRIFEYWDQVPDKPPLSAEVGLIRNYLKAAAKRPCTRAEAKEVIELCGPGQFSEQAQAFVKAMLRQDPRDPLFRMFDYMLNPRWAFAPPEECRRQLEPILEEARRRGDQELIRRIQQVLKGLDRPPPLPPIPPPEGADLDLEEEFEDEPDITPDEFGEMAEVMEILANASEAELRQMRKHRPKDMPEFIFDMLIKAAKSRDSLPPLPPPPTPRRSKSPRQPDPNQGNLF
jgi:tetratricopeptide (TPR) repeat protein